MTSCCVFEHRASVDLVETEPVADIDSAVTQVQNSTVLLSTQDDDEGNPASNASTFFSHMDQCGLRAMRKGVV